MGFYGDRVFPHLMNAVMNTKETRRIRRDVCAPLSGDVLEIGFGSGHNLPFLPPSVTTLLAVDPLERGRQLASERLAASPCNVEFIGLDGQELPLEDASVDAALSTWTLCSIDDPVAAIREIRRVLRRGGLFHFAEHGRAPDQRVQRWQDRCNGIQNKIACGCNLNRDIPAIVSEGGLEVQEIETFYAKGDPKPLGWTFQGRASAS
jgi:SAM-dependent methyltransferase